MPNSDGIFYFARSYDLKKSNWYTITDILFVTTYNMENKTVGKWNDSIKLISNICNHLITFIKDSLLQQKQTIKTQWCGDQINTRNTKLSKQFEHLPQAIK